jgi:hypothetical protein
VIRKDADTYTYKKGLFVIVQSGDAVKILNDQEFNTSETTDFARFKKKNRGSGLGFRVSILRIGRQGWFCPCWDHSSMQIR